MHFRMLHLGKLCSKNEKHMKTLKVSRVQLPLGVASGWSTPRPFLLAQPELPNLESTQGENPKLL